MSVKQVREQCTRDYKLDAVRQEAGALAQQCYDESFREPT